MGLLVAGRQLVRLRATEEGKLDLMKAKNLQVMRRLRRAEIGNVMAGALPSSSSRGDSNRYRCQDDSPDGKTTRPLATKPRSLRHVFSADGKLITGEYGKRGDRNILFLIDIADRCERVCWAIWKKTTHHVGIPRGSRPCCRMGRASSTQWQNRKPNLRWLELAKTGLCSPDSGSLT